MKKIFSIVTMFIVVFILVGCNNRVENDELNIVSSFTIITNITEEIVKDKANVHNLVPTGTDPHEYEPLPNDLKAMTDADIVFYGGMNLEGGKDGWLFKLAKATNKSEKIMHSLSDGIEPLYLFDEETLETQINPHFFIDPHNGIVMAQNILRVLIEVDPKNESFYTTNANDYIDKLETIKENYLTGLNKIPDDKRILVTSERAFQYLAKSYNIIEAYIWELDTGETGTPKQISSLIEFLNNNPVPYLLVESNVERSPMQTISDETNIPIYHKPIYSDEIGRKGDEVDTYIKYLEYNLEVILEGMNINDYE